MFWSDRVSVAQKLSLDKSTLSTIYPNEKVEVGILSIHPEYTTNHSIWGLTGFTQSFDSEKREKLLYQFTTKHRSIDSDYYVDFLRPTGLHPKHKITMTTIKPPRSECSLFAKYSMSKSLFLDRYQLKDLAEPTPNRMAIGRLHGVWGETDLEAPIWAVDGWGSEALVQIYTKNKNNDGSLTFELPTHSRYEIPQANSSVVHEYQPWPVVFWACLPPSKDEESLENKIPKSVETRNIGYESIFPENTIFYYLNPSPPSTLPSSRLQSEFDIPVAPFSAYSTVQTVSVVVIFSCFFYLLYIIFMKFFAFNRSSVSPRKKNK